LQEKFIYIIYLTTKLSLTLNFVNTNENKYILIDNNNDLGDYLLQRSTTGLVSLTGSEREVYHNGNKSIEIEKLIWISLLELRKLST